MTDFVTYDYAVSVTLKEAIQAVSLSYLRKVAVICMNKDEASTGLVIHEDLTSQTAIDAITNESEIGKLLTAGLPSVTLIALGRDEVTLELIKAAVASLQNKVLTVLVSQRIGANPTEIMEMAKLSGGVIGKAFTRDQIEDAKLFASQECAFIDDDQDRGAMYYAFGALLSSATWSSHQYMAADVVAQNVTVANAATAKLYQSERLSFFLDDSSLGRRLGFFVAGGKSITDRYVTAEIARKIQEVGVQYISRENPMNVEDARDSLSLSIKANVFTPYEDAGLIIADESTVKLSGSLTDAFTATGTFKVEKPSALWRLDIQLVG